MKVFKTFPLLLVFLGLIPGCCPDIDPYYMPTDMAVKSIWNNSLYVDFEDLTIENADGFELWIEFTGKEYFSQSTTSFNFRNTLMATQPCPEDGQEGLKSTVSSLKITSSSEFQGIEPGESINEFFHRLEPAGADDMGNQTYDQKSVDTGLDRFHFLSFYEPHIPLYLSELPGNNLVHVFTVELTFENGTSISSTSSEVQF